MVRVSAREVTRRGSGVVHSCLIVRNLLRLAYLGNQVTVSGVL